MKKFYFTTFFIYISISIYATIRNVPASYPTIQAALNSCAANDTVLVQPGIYFENITWVNIANIKLFSAGDSSNTTINGNNNGSVISISGNMVDTNTVIKGFKITGGFKSGTSANGAGILIYDCSPKFEEVLITGNRLAASNWDYGAGINGNNTGMVINNSSISANQTDSSQWGYGGGVYLSGTGTPYFRNVKINNNLVKSDSWNYGTGVYCYGTDAVFENVMVTGNIAAANAIWYHGTGMYFRDCSVRLTNVLIADNIMGIGGIYYYGAGIYADGLGDTAAVSMMNVTISGNHKSDNTLITGSGIYNYAPCDIDITNSIVWNVNSGNEIQTGGSGFSVITVTYSDFRNGYTGTGNINTNPGFVSAFDYHLQASSPCINAGTLTGAPSFDLDNMPRPLPTGSNPDMGCYESDQATSVFATGENKNTFHNYPNPFSMTTTFAFPDEILKYNCSLFIFDTSGKIVFESQINQPSLEISKEDLNSGIYFYKVVSDGNIAGSGKMVAE